MFGISSGIIPRLFDNPQRYYGDFRPPSPDPPCQSLLSHSERSHPLYATATATAAGGNEGTIAPIRQHEVVLPTRRAPPHAPQHNRHRGRLTEEASTGNARFNTTASPNGTRNGFTAAATAASAGLAASVNAPAVLTTQEPLPHRSQQRQQEYHHHHDPRHARSSEAHRAGDRGARDTTTTTATNGRQNSSINNTNGNSGAVQNTTRLSEVLISGLRGLQTYMGTVFHSPNSGGINVHPTPYEATSSNSTYRVPEIPAEPAMQRTSSEIVTERERRHRTRTQITGIPMDEQHNLLRRLRFMRSAFVQETESTISGSMTRCNSTDSPLSMLTPLSALVPRGGAGCTLESWVVSLDAADPLQVPFPAVSRSCSVCLRKFQDEEDVAELACGHLYHFTCIIRWLQRQGSCPCCRTDVRKLAKPKESAQRGDKEGEGEKLMDQNRDGVTGF